MIRVEVGEERDGPGENTGRRHGKWHWMCAQYGVEGFSRQPLLDACRQLKSLGADPSTLVGLFRSGTVGPDLSCAVGVGAGLTVDETSMRFVKFHPFDPKIRDVSSRN